jgi:hypothetical protein
MKPLVKHFGEPRVYKAAEVKPRNKFQKRKSLNPLKWVKNFTQ